MIVVDDSPSMDSEIFNMEEFEGADWVLVTDELPLDEARRRDAREVPGDLPRRDGREITEAQLQGVDEPELDDDASARGLGPATHGPREP